MPNFNKVFLIGNLTRDPELKKTSSDTAMATFDLAINYKYRDASGSQEESVCFVHIVAWDKLAENCATYLGKGKLVFVEGRLKLNTWQKDAKVHRKLLVQAISVRFLSPAEATDATDEVAASDEDQTTTEPSEDES